MHPPDGAACVAFEDMYAYVIKGAVTDCVYQITTGVVCDPIDVAETHAKRIDHTVMVGACAHVKQAGLSVAPVIRRALEAYDGTMRDVLSTAAERPVATVGNATPALIVMGKYYDMSQQQITRALSYYDLLHPWADIVKSLLPQNPPDLSSQDKIYAFIGERFAPAILAARARRLIDAIQNLAD